MDMYKQYLQMVAERVPPAANHVDPTVVGLSDIPEHCGETYVFRTRDDLRRVMETFGLPERCGPFTNGGHMARETAFLFYIRRMSSVANFSDFKVEFGHDKSTWSRCFSWMVDFVEKNHAWRFEAENLPFFEARFDYYAESIRAVVNKKAASIHEEGGGVLFPLEDPLFSVAGDSSDLGAFSIACFIDGNVTETCTPGTGPATPGPGAARRPNADNEQEGFYTGWLHKHGIKNLTVDTPDGLTMFIYGPTSLRHNDLHSLLHSNINTEMYFVQRHMPGIQHKLMYGDSIFPWRTHLRARHNAPAGDADKRKKDIIDRAMSSGRQMVEHHYGEAGNLFPFMRYKYKIKIQKMNLKGLYIGKMLLRNMYVCLYGNKTSKRFECTPPVLEAYMVAR